MTINLQNWRDWRTLWFRSFTEKATQQWINEGFDKDQAKEWGRVNISTSLHGLKNESSYVFFLSNKKSLIPSEFKQLTKEEKDKLKQEYDEWFQQFFICSHCQKRLLIKNVYFQKEVNKLCWINICSSDCQEQAKTYAQEWLDRWYPKNDTCLRKDELTDTDDSKVEINNFGRTREQITKLDVSAQDLSGSLDLSDFTKLEELCCPLNQLTHLELGKNDKLKVLSIGFNNFPSQRPSWLSHLINLEMLYLNNNDFKGSLSFVKNMINLESINIEETNFTNILEHLPLSLKKIWCNGNDQIKNQLSLYNDNLLLWKFAHPDLMIQAGQDKINVNHFDVEPFKLTTIPDFLQDNLKIQSLSSNNYHPNLKYSRFLLNNGSNFNWKTQDLKDSSIFLPLRLYQISTNQILDSELITNNSNYAIMSYVWGDLSDKDNLTTWDYTYQNKNGIITPKQIGVNADYGATGTTRESIKALKKARETVKFLNKEHNANLDYLWMDQICINQFDHIEQGQEVGKMRHYYGNAATTLIAIDAEIGDEINNDDCYQVAKTALTKIASSTWFTRSWTFQEGLLSKQTVFIFDDYLVDGRMLALAWGGLQISSGKYIFSRWKVLNNAPQIFITPLGWSHGTTENHSINLTLGESILPVKHRQQAILVDSIYSILGTLPYGDQLDVNYKSKDCSCSPEQKKDCQHWPVYTKQDLEQALKQLSNLNFSRNKFNEIFSWIGSLDNNCWFMPQINDDGLISIEGLTSEFSPIEGLQITSQGIYLSKTKTLKVKKISTNDEFINLEFTDLEPSESSIFLINTKLPLKPQRSHIKVGDKLVVISKENEVHSLDERMKRFSWLAILIPKSKLCSIEVVKIESVKLLMHPQNIFLDLTKRKIKENQSLTLKLKKFFQKLTPQEQFQQVQIEEISSK